MSWRSEELTTRCCRESHHPAEGALGTPSEFGDPLVTRCGRKSQHSTESWAPGPPVKQHWRTRKTTPSHTHHTFQIKWEVYILKEDFVRLYSLCQYIFCICVYNTNTLEKSMNPLSSLQWIKKYYLNHSTKMASSLNNQIKPNYE